MSNSNKYSIIIICVFFLNFLFLVPLGNAKTTLIIDPLKDTFIVNGINSSNNFSLYNYCVIRNNGSERIDSLYYFELPNNYAEYDNVAFSFYAFLLGAGSPDAYNVSIYNINENWNESSVTWDSRPSNSELLLNTTIIKELQSIDFKAIIPSHNFSICINSTTVQNGFVQVFTKEYTGTEQSLVIILSDNPVPTVPGYEILIILSVSGVVIIFSILKKYRMHS